MMFPMLNSVKLCLLFCLAYAFLSVIRLLKDYAIGCDSRSIVQNHTIE